MLSQDIKTAELIYRVAAGSPEHGQNGFSSAEECAALRRVIEAARKLPPIVTALKVADKINVDREGFDGPDGHAADGLPADHALTPEFRDEWRVIREAVESGEVALGAIQRLDAEQQLQIDLDAAITRFTSNTKLEDKSLIFATCLDLFYREIEKMLRSHGLLPVQMVWLIKQCEGVFARLVVWK